MTIKPNISAEDYAFIKLGTYIDEHLLPKLKSLNSVTSKIKTKSFKKDKSSKNSTINSKVEFCEYAIKHIATNNLSDESIRVAKSILDFILRNNPQLL